MNEELQINRFLGLQLDAINEGLRVGKKASKEMNAIETVFLMTPDEVEDNRKFHDSGDFDQSMDDEDYY